MSTEDLVAFVTARLDDDEQIARGALKGGPCIAEYDSGRDLPAEQWSSSYHEVRQSRVDGEPYGSGLRRIPVADCGPANVYPARHIARHDPARVLRDVNAKRAILGRHRHQRFTEPLDANSKWEEDRRPAFAEAPRYVGCVSCSYDTRYEEVYPSWWCEHVRLLAAPYVDHPDYNPAWSLADD